MKQISRRVFLVNGSLLLCATATTSLQAGELFGENIQDEKPSLRAGLVTDIHYSEKPPARNRYYHQSLEKLREGIDLFNKKRVDFAVELGDLVDAAESVNDEIALLKRIDKEYAQLQADRHYVLGNHCTWTLTKKQFIENCGAKNEFYSFDRGGFHFVVLDGCYRSDGVPYGNKNFKWTDSDIPMAQQEWLKEDLKRANSPSIIFVHQRLDVKNNYGIKSAPAVRNILEESKSVLAVFQGHSHKNDYHQINGIHYCTLRAVIEGSGEINNGYGILSLYKNGNLLLDGFRQQQNYNLRPLQNS